MNTSVCPWPFGRASVPFFFGASIGFFALLFIPSSGLAQEPPNIPDLEQEYRLAQAEYDVAFRALEQREAQFEQALADHDAARIAGDAAVAIRALTAVNRLAAELREVRLRVDQRAQELRGSRYLLIQAYRRRVDGLIAQVASAQDESDRAGLVALLEDANNRRLELLGEEEPVTVLEPMRDLTISPTDTPRDILRKASTLEYRAEQDSVRLEEVNRQLEELREDQALSRSVSDMLSGLDRFGDTRLPIGPPGARTAPPDSERLLPGADSLVVETRPMTLEERIESLELLASDLGERIVQIQAKALRFRARAGGEVAL